MSVLKTALIALLLACAWPAGPAAARGAIEARATLEIRGEKFPVHAAGVTLMNRPPDLEAIRILAARDAGGRQEPAYQYHRFLRLVRTAENTRRAGVRGKRSGIFFGRTDRNGEIVIPRLPAGRYYLAVYRQTAGGAGAAWFIPVTVTRGAISGVALDNNNAFALYERRPR